LIEGELVSADLDSDRVDEKGTGVGLAEELQTMPIIRSHSYLVYGGLPVAVVGIIAFSWTSACMAPW
jgi:hypothetical protein